MSFTPEYANHRLLLYYKGDISALMLFVQHSSGNVCFPQPLPPLSSALASPVAQAPKIDLHPLALLNHINEQFQLDDDLLKLDFNFSEPVDTPEGVITVHMARFTLLDPPHKLMQSRDCRMRTLPELRNQPPTELELLRRAYVKAMEF